MPLNSQVWSQYTPPSSGGGSPISLTYSDAQTLVTNGTVVFGQQYLITDAAGTDLGALVVGMQDGKSFSLQGSGGFLNPDFQNVGDYSGAIDISGNPFTNNYGIWQLSNEGGYGVGDVVIWNGLHYQVKDNFNSSSPDMDTDGFQLLPKTAPNVGYITVWDRIEFDFAHNNIQNRKDSIGNDISSSYSTIQNVFSLNAISKFQWGNDNNVFGNTVKESLLDCINFAGSGINCTTVSNGSIITANCTAPSCGIKQCVFTNEAIANLNAITINYFQKTLSYSESTFDAVIDCTGGGTLNEPDYLGIIGLDSSNASETITDFTSQPTFKRLFYVKGAVAMNQAIFNNSSNLVFPTPSTGTTIIKNGSDFIEFLYKPLNNSFIQTASEQY